MALPGFGPEHSVSRIYTIIPYNYVAHPLKLDSKESSLSLIPYSTNLQQHVLNDLQNIFITSLHIILYLFHLHHFGSSHYDFFLLLYFLICLAFSNLLPFSLFSVYNRNNSAKVHQTISFLFLKPSSGYSFHTE